MTEKIFKGISVSDGIRIGKAFFYKPFCAKITSDSITEENIQAEISRFSNAILKAKDELSELISNLEKTENKDKSGVIKGQLGFLADPAFSPEINKLIEKRLYNSERAVSEVSEKFALMFENMKNSYMRERAADIRDTGSRLIRILSGGACSSLSEISDEIVLFAEDLSPTDTISLNKEKVLAFVTFKGGKTSHTAIFAKSMGIPAIVGASEINGNFSDGDTVIVDAISGICIVNPDTGTIAEYERKIADEKQKQEFLMNYANKPALTSDGESIIIAANIGSYEDAEFSLSQGADASGLLRTELFYLSASTLPDEEKQFEQYKSIASLFSPKEVIVRTLDIGGDKEVSYLKIPKEENPFLGYRAIRLCLDQQELFLTQLRAILRASAYGKLKIMFPMISSIDELFEAKALLEKAKAQLDDSSYAYDKKIQVGMMIEIPSAAVMADVFAEEVDFFSIGTNDLIQYTLACDRGNEKVSHLYDFCNPAVIRLIDHTAKSAEKGKILIGMCGGMAGDPLAIPLLIGMGFDELSMASTSIVKAKYITLKVSKSNCQKLREEVLKCRDAKEIRHILNEFYHEYIGVI
ncbi:MAG TPA: phosphoenolpyruvate--protein phosphotransferase [Oscillospiraceae bacterium]|nr:phosphoenolpyruvate--protein phosphotransferase [Oscillospiraceae bacterium]